MPAASAGYSDTPLVKKFAIAAGATVCPRFARGEYETLLAVGLKLLSRKELW